MSTSEGASGRRRTALHPGLANLVARRRGLEDDAGAAGLESAARVHVMVKFTGDLEDLRAVGFEPSTLRQHPTEGWSIAAGSVSVDGLAALDQIPHVVKVEGSRPMQRELDRSVPEINVDELHNLSEPLKGAGVVVGIIDAGVDYTHQNFRHSDGTSRILGILDQKQNVTYTQGQINTALQGGAPLLTVDGKDGHGTHVAGIAAGDGSQAGDCRGQFTYVGVAPEADIIFVVFSSDTTAIGESENLINAMEFIWQHPRVAGRPVVINISLGDNLGPHDGTSLVEQMIDLDILINPAHVVIKSAGNEGDTNRHAEVTIAAGDTADLRFTVPSGVGFSRYIECWYEGAGSVRTTVLAPGDPRPASPPVEPNNSNNWTVNQALPANQRTVVRMDSRTLDSDNNDNSIHIELDPAAAARLPSGEWLLRLRNTGAAPVTVDAWIERSDNGPAFHTDDATRAGTISIPGTAQSVITVGAYAQSGFLFFDWTGDLAASSSRGPTRDGRTKPDIAAPGVGIKSAQARSSTNCCCDCCGSFYTNMNGTSMAAPHVTGVAALMFQQDPNLTAALVKEHLMNTARVPDGVDPDDLPDSNWGAGKVDAAAAVDEVANADADAGGGRGGGGVRRRGGGVPPGPQDAGAASLLSAVHHHLLSTPGGEEWAAVASRHFSEVRGLINHNRRVAMRWHRMDGPDLVALLAHLAAGSPAGVVLPAVDFQTLGRRVDEFLGALERYGSPALGDAVGRVRPDLLALVSPALVDVLRALAHAARPAA